MIEKSPSSSLCAKAHVRTSCVAERVLRVNIEKHQIFAKWFIISLPHVKQGHWGLSISFATGKLKKEEVCKSSKFLIILVGNLLNHLYDDSARVVKKKKKNPTFNSFKVLV